MRRRSWMALAGLALALSCSQARAAGDVHFSIGSSQMQDDSWDSGKSGGTVGVRVLLAGTSWPVRVDAGLRATSTIGLFGDSVSTKEWGVGVAKVFDKGGRIRPFLAAGIALVSASGDVTVPGSGNNVHVSDGSTGGYFDGGVFWRVGSRFDIGTKVHALFGTELSGDITGGGHVEADVDNYGIDLILGFGW